MLHLRSLALVSVVFLSCQPADAPFLEVTTMPRSIDGRGAATNVIVSAFKRPEVPGEGTVRLSSPVGSFSPPVTVMLDANGTGSAPFTCMTATEAACSSRVTITAEWLYKEMAYSSEVRLTISPAGGGSAAGGSAAGGSAAGGSAAGGSAAGGSAAGGSAAGGSAAGGSAAGGSAAGGSAAGGSAAGGSAAGGSAAGGSAAGGSAAGGSAGGGSAAGTPNDIRGTVIDPEGIVAFGVLANNTCHGAYAAIDAGNRPSVGVPCNLNPTHAFLRPDGGFIYRHPTTGRVLAAVPDPMGSTSGGWLYPTLDAGVAANDLDLTPAPCTGATLRFLLRPDTGSVVAQCADGTWREGSTPLPALDGTDVIAFAVNGSALVGTDAGLQLISASGTVTPVSAPFGPISKMTRANAQGFLAVRFTPPCSLYQLTLSGTATKLGDYTTTTTLPGTVPVFCNGRIDASGTLFYGTTSIGGSQIIRRPLVPGSMSYAFGTNTMSTVWDFGPRFNLLLQDGNGMVAAP